MCLACSQRCCIGWEDDDCGCECDETACFEPWHDIGCTCDKCVAKAVDYVLAGME